MDSVSHMLFPSHGGLLIATAPTATRLSKIFTYPNIVSDKKNLTIPNKLIHQEHLVFLSVLTYCETHNIGCFIRTSFLHTVKHLILVVL